MKILSFSLGNFYFLFFLFKFLNSLLSIFFLFYPKESSSWLWDIFVVIVFLFSVCLSVFFSVSIETYPTLPSKPGIGKRFL